MKKVLTVCIAACMLFLGFVGIELYQNIQGGLNETASVVSEDKKDAKEAVASAAATEEQTEETTTKEPDRSLTLVSLGDNLIHDSLLQAATQADGSYNFDFEFEKIAPDIQNADLAVINQETMMGGDLLPYGGYPNFNSPYAVADAENKAGFDVILHASNHSRDVYEEGIENCLAYWTKNYPQMKILGINASQKAKDTIPVIEKNGIKIAMLNYTYGLNGYSLSAEKSYLVNLLDDNRYESDIKKAKQMADFVIVFPHWGVEYQMQNNEEQKALAQKMADAGADLIIGTHPHVLQNIEWLNGKNGNKTLCYYSLGNYISGQDQTIAMLGGTAKVELKKSDGKTTIRTAKLVPLLTYYSYGFSTTATYKLSEFPGELWTQHGVSAYDGTFSKDEINRLLNDTIDAKWLADV